MFEKSRTSSQARVHHSKSSEQKSRPPSGTVARTSEGDSSRQRLSAKLQKTSTMRECVTKSETFTPLSPKLESISAVDESCDFDYQSDENPFDVSSILRAANEGESHAPEAVEYSKASWDVLDYLMEESPKTKVIDKGNCWDVSMFLRWLMVSVLNYVEERPWWPIQTPNNRRKKKAKGLKEREMRSSLLILDLKKGEL